MNQALALTPGEPAGIGPDLAIMLAQEPRDIDLVVIADKQLLNARAATLNLPLRIEEYVPGKSVATRAAGVLSVRPVALRTTSECGKLDCRNSPYVLETLDVAVDGCLSGDFAAMVTAPLHKGVINDAGIAFTGHTEYLAERLNSDPVMMLATETQLGPLRVALVTTHLPLSKVAETISVALIKRTMNVLYSDLKLRFGIATPRILVAGLNPHAGESGHMGREEIDIIEPALEQLRAQGMELIGPLPADTLFTPQHLQSADAVMVMFHDQGLPVLKYAGFGNAINITLGLPIIRTSVDHGTALDKAGTGNIDSGSLKAALALASELISSQQDTKHS